MAKKNRKSTLTGMWYSTSDLPPQIQRSDREARLLFDEWTEYIKEKINLWFNMNKGAFIREHDREAVHLAALNGLWRAARMWKDPDKGSGNRANFSTYAWLLARRSAIWWIWREYPKKRRSKEVPYYFDFSEEEEGNIVNLVADPREGPESSIEVEELISEIDRRLANPRDKKVFQMLLAGMDRKTMAKQLSISKQYTAKIIERIRLEAKLVISKYRKF